MERLEKLIQWYENNTTSNYEELICKELKVINDMFDELDDLEEKLFIDKIIRIFCEVLENHHDKIDSLEGMIEHLTYNSNKQQNFVPVYAPQMEGFETDEQLQKAFTYYLTHEVKKPLSSYTINDYCSRIKILWKTFYDAYKNQELSQNLRVMEEQVTPDEPLLNVYNHLREICDYIHFQIEKEKDNKNWINARAAFNKFQEFAINTLR